MYGINFTIEMSYAIFNRGQIVICAIRNRETQRKNNNVTP
jgi:hypothetical protein